MGAFGIVLSTFSLFKLIHDLLQFKLSFLFAKLIEFWNAYPIRMILETFAIFSIEVSAYTANIISLFIFYAISMFKSQRFFAGYLATIWQQKIRKQEGQLSLLISIPAFPLLLNLTHPAIIFWYTTVPILLSILLLWALSVLLKNPHSPKNYSLIAGAITFGMFYWLSGILFGLVAFICLFSINYAFL